MIFLILSILSTSFLLLLFKIFARLNINIQQAVVFNYLAASVLALSINPPESFSEIRDAPWIWIALLLGMIFFVVFSVVSYSGAVLGTAVTTTSYKMSLIIPVIVAIVLYHDTFNFWRVGGLILALVSLFLTSPKLNTEVGQKKISGLLKFVPVFIFLGSGLADTLVMVGQNHYKLAGKPGLFIAVIFSAAAFSGLIFMLVRSLRGIEKKISLRSIAGGVLLGAVNYATLYFLMMALGCKPFERSVIFVINNVGIVMITSTAAYSLLKEELGLRQRIGILVAVVAIVLTGIN